MNVKVRSLVPQAGQLAIDIRLSSTINVTAFSARQDDFQQRNCGLLGISADPIELHREWLAAPPFKDTPTPGG